MYSIDRGRALFSAAKWALGFPTQSHDESSTGFDIRSLVPERQRTLAERGIALLTSLTVAFMLFGWILIDVGQLDLNHGVLYTLAGALWVARMVLPPRVPMDRTSIALAGYTLAPWAVHFLFGTPGRSVAISVDLLSWLGMHVVGLTACVVIGLALDVRAEMRAKDTFR